MSVVEFKDRDAYSVPRRFGLRSILGVTALFAVLFAFIKWSDQSPAVPLFYAVFLIVISVAQMAFEKTPRLASIAGGAIYLPAGFYFEPSIQSHLQFSHWSENVLTLAIAGGFLAYLGGTLIAGIYLLTDRISRLLSKRKDCGMC